MLIEESIRAKIMKNLDPLYLNIINESLLHHGNTGSETHFKIEVVSKKFKDLKRLERHRLVQNVIKDELSAIKAFSLHPFTFEEWEKRNKSFERSPTCRGSNE